MLSRHFRSWPSQIPGSLQGFVALTSRVCSVKAKCRNCHIYQRVRLRDLRRRLCITDQNIASLGGSAFDVVDFAAGFIVALKAGYIFYSALLHIRSAYVSGCDILPPVNGVGFLCIMQSLHPAKDVFYRFSVPRELPPFEVLHSLPERDFPSVRG